MRPITDSELPRRAKFRIDNAEPRFAVVSNEELSPKRTKLLILIEDPTHPSPRMLTLPAPTRTVPCVESELPIRVKARTERPLPELM